MKFLKSGQRSAVAAALALAFAGPALAHHGIGLFVVNQDVEYSGVLTKMELVNPHSYMYFDYVNEAGETVAMRCEMRAATLLKRSGWTADMFVVGAPVEIKARPHRDDPGACYLESFSLGEKPAVGRNDQLTSSSAPVDTSDRPLRLASGEPNISGDWAVEQAVLTISPSGSRDMVPKSLREAYAAGEITLQEIRSRESTSRPVYTEAGRAAAEDFEMWSVEDNPRLSCNPTSIVYDWTWDWPVNRIIQTTTPGGERVIDIDYGLYAMQRRIHLDMDSHPENLTPSNAGHSIGRWEGDTLVVDTVGFTAGVLAPPTRNSEQMHVVERFTLDTGTMALRRDWTVTDPVYLAEPWTGFDVVYVSETPFERHPCKELTPEFINE